MYQCNAGIRCSMHEVITSSIFGCFIEDGASIIAQKSGYSYSVSYMHYFRPPESGGSQNLPLL